ncbi:hypothetical protein GCM10007416_21000 [Kroppenstedtia guangzhouensis]|uniref:NlpC/P60 domain-containing protein n=1 Tax=Kroppenstedtia guangzhouensis TaxID=1274356 RepID=A0ABQ1GP40_9BACL|nr:C40 family peptidase [Kroppenstedtia guangzhouensis]GGA47657.1 hypothetical protein GCM10007416_21000 [Kroppenstedtia guangzhouensis]
MRTPKIFQKVLLTSTALLLVGTTAPAAGQAHAAAANNSMIQSIFEQVGLQYNFGKTVKEEPKQTTEEPTESKPQPSQPSEPSNSSDEQKPSQSEQNNSFGDKIIATGEKYMGTPYKYGANYARDGKFDCSAFTQHVFKQNGVNLPRSSRSQSKVGVEVPRNQIQKGDLLFFKLRGQSQIGHVAIYAGNGKVLHTWGPGGVRYDKLSTPWLDQGFVKATRVR